MKVSLLSNINAKKSVIDKFGGYNHNLQISDNEFYDMENMTSDYYPLLSPRRERSAYSYTATDGKHPNGLIAKDAICHVNGNKLYVNNLLAMTLSSDASKIDTPRQLISMGAYIIVMPDKKYYNTLNSSDYGDIESSYSAGQSKATITNCKADGTALGTVTVSPAAPSAPVGGDLWIDTSSAPHTLKSYSTTTVTWVVVTETYLRIKVAGINEAFSEGDAVTLNGTGVSDLDGKTSIIRATGVDSGVGYIVVVGLIDASLSNISGVTASRTMPKMDFVIESGNRLWGCRYGTNNGNAVVNEIYASKLGDFKNWNYFAGTSMDSYVASCGTDGAFTGAINHLGYPLFFKEDCLHKVYGNYPSNYQVQMTPCKGVQKGCGESLAIVNGVLFYKGRNGVCKYDGSLPQEISWLFGDVHYTAVDATKDAVDPLRSGAFGGAYQNKYYLSAKSEIDGTWNLLVYDTSLKMWHREDHTRISAFAVAKGTMYFVDFDTKDILKVTNNGAEDKKDFDWSVTSGKIGTLRSDRNYISRMDFKFKLDLDSTVSVFIEYDSGEVWQHVATVQGTSLQTFILPVRPRRCDHFRYMICGRGDAKLFSLSMVIEDGSDVK